MLSVIGIVIEVAPAPNILFLVLLKSGSHLVGRVLSRVFNCLATFLFPIILLFLCWMLTMALVPAKWMK